MYVRYLYPELKEYFFSAVGVVVTFLLVTDLKSKLQQFFAEHRPSGLLAMDFKDPDVIAPDT